MYSTSLANIAERNLIKIKTLAILPEARTSPPLSTPTRSASRDEPTLGGVGEREASPTKRSLPVAARSHAIIKKATNSGNCEQANNEEVSVGLTLQEFTR